MNKEPNEFHKHLSPQKLTTIQYSINSYTTINTPYNWLVFLAASSLNTWYMSSYELVRMCN